MIIYLCGPIKGMPDYKAHFARAERKLTAEGHIVINPAEMDHVVKGNKRTRETFLKLDMHLLRASHAVYMLPGWQNSEGARAERRQAIRLGKNVIYAKEEP